MTETNIPASFSDELVRRLAVLHDVPESAAASTIVLYGTGTRALLASQDPPLIKEDEGTLGLVRITPEGWDVFRACAERVSGDVTRSPEPGSWAVNHEDRLRGVLEALAIDQVYVIHDDRVAPDPMEATEAELRAYLAGYAADDPAWDLPVLAQGTRLFADFGSGWEEIGYAVDHAPGWEP